MYLKLLLVFVCMTCASAKSDDTYEVLLTDIEQLYPEQYPIGYYDRYNLNAMARDDNRVDLPTGGHTDFSEILRSIVFDRDFYPETRYRSQVVNPEPYPSLEDK